MDNDPDAEVRRRTRVAFCYHDLGVTLGRLLNEGETPQQMVKAIEHSFLEWKESQEKERKPKGFHEWKVHGLLDDIRRTDGDDTKDLLERATRLLQESLKDKTE